MIVDNISLSPLDESISMLEGPLEESQDNSTESLDDEIPSGIMEAIERI